MLVTLDTHAVAAVEAGVPSAHAVRRVVDAHHIGKLDVAIPVLSAPGLSRQGAPITNFADFKARLQALGFDDLTLLRPMGYWGVTFFDYCAFAGYAAKQIEEKIHNALFPDISYNWAKHSITEGVNPENRYSEAYRIWRSAKCDVQMIWAHIAAKRSLFATDNAIFLRNEPALLALGVGTVTTLEETAAQLLP